MRWTNADALRDTEGLSSAQAAAYRKSVTNKKGAGVDALVCLALELVLRNYLKELLVPKYDRDAMLGVEAVVAHKSNFAS